MISTKARPLQVQYDCGSKASDGGKFMVRVSLDIDSAAIGP
jgi:hypothetical protein